MKKISMLSIIVLSIVFLPAADSEAAARTALVIGNSGYNSVPLANPVNDAEDVAAALGRLGFDVILRKDADKQEIKNAMRAFGRKLPASEIGLFYYAGHGMQIKGVNYLIPVANDIKEEWEVGSEAIGAGRVLAAMEAAGNPMNIVILDACRDNPFRSFRTSAKGLAKMDAPSGTVIAYATSPGSVAEDGPGRNGTYTASLLKNIENSSLDVQKMFNQTGLDVMSKTGKSQVPWLSTTPFPDYYLAEQKPDFENQQVNTKASDSKARLFVSATPSDARVRIMNIKPPYHDGIVLDPGNYQIRVDRKGYQTREQWKQVRAGEEVNLSVALDEIKPVIGKREAAGIDDLLAEAQLEEQKRKAGIEREKQRKAALKQTIEKYELLIKKYGDQYKQQAWDAICADFPALTQGLETGDILNLRQKASILRQGDTFTDPVTGMAFVWVPGGCYQMGCGSWTDDCDSDETPVHKVCVDGFWMGKYEVTQGQWQQIMGRNPSSFQRGDRYPVESVSWNVCQKFIEKLNARSGQPFRLPTEAEWEYAARSGGKPEKYSGGTDVDSVAWYRENSGGKTRRAGTRAPNGFGLYDMSGNVWEWCEDVYDKDAYLKHSRNNPLVTSGSWRRVARGGSWGNDPWYVRAASRDWFRPGYAYDVLGFRLCLSRVR